MTHGEYSTYVQGCRCPECKKANAAYHQQLRLARKPEMARNHGTTATYSNYRCRCDFCSAANSRYFKELRARYVKGHRGVKA